MPSTTLLKKYDSRSSIDRSRLNTKSSVDRSSSQLSSTSSRKSSAPNTPGGRESIACMKCIGSISTKSTYVNKAEQRMPEKLLIEKIERKMSPRKSIEKKLKQGRRESTVLTASLLGLTDVNANALLLEDKDLYVEDVDVEIEEDLDPKFKSCYAPEEMRCMALVAHNHMEPAMKKIAMANKNLLKKFRLTGNNTTMTMLREVFGNDPEVVYGPTCTSDPLGGCAELVAAMCTENLGACVFLQDPMSSQPRGADMQCLIRQANVHNILLMSNPSTAYVMLASFRIALEKGKAELIPSFFETLKSPSVEEYNKEQARVPAANIEGEDLFF